MVDASSALPAGITSGRHGLPHGPAGVVLTEQTGLQLASLHGRRGQTAALATAIRERWSLDLPETPRWVGDAKLAILWAGPHQWLVAAETGGEPLHTTLRTVAGTTASVAAQGDGRIVLRLGGPRARDVLAKCSAIDLHPRAFRPGDTALTLLAHIGVQIRQISETPEYEIIAFRSYGGSLAETLMAAGEEYGIEVVRRG